MSKTAAMVATTLDHLESVGIIDYVLCAGARNAPLVAALTQTAGVSGLRLWHHFDERTASFYALGLAKRNGRPVAVLTTSGTAAAELLPAAVEAYYSAVPLVLVTADRPPRFRGSGAPQSIEQVGLFGIYASILIDAQREEDFAEIASWDQGGPLHLNVCLEEPEIEIGHAPRPLLPKRESTTVKPEASPELRSEFAAWFADMNQSIVMLGELPESWREAVADFLLRTRLPFWAEATSGLREDSRLATQALRSERDLAAIPVARVCRIGGVPSCRFWRDLETKPQVAVLSISPRPWSGLARSSTCLVSAAFPKAHSVPAGREPSVTSQALRLEELLKRLPASEPALLRKLSEMIPSSALVFLGNSLPIREWNLAASLDHPHPHCRANRGANGIDGEVATFLGLACDETEAWGIFGDLTALYDLNAPALLVQMPPGQRRIVVLNNGGGRIFARLPALARLDERARVITENRHRVRFEAWAELWGLAYVRWPAHEPMPDLPPGDLVLEVVVDQETSEAFWQEWQ